MAGQFEPTWDDLLRDHAQPDNQRVHSAIWTPKINVIEVPIPDDPESRQIVLSRPPDIAEYRHSPDGGIELSHLIWRQEVDPITGNRVYVVYCATGGRHSKTRNTTR